jgi:hypothetical protein
MMRTRYVRYWHVCDIRGLLTGARLREIYSQSTLNEGCLLLPDSKTGRKSIVLNAPAMAVLATLPRIGAYVIAGDNPEHISSLSRRAANCPLPFPPCAARVTTAGKSAEQLRGIPL